MKSILIIFCIIWVSAIIMYLFAVKHAKWRDEEMELIDHEEQTSTHDTEQNT